jgi:hypothetical protein
VPVAIAPAVPRYSDGSAVAGLRPQRHSTFTTS